MPHNPTSASHAASSASRIRDWSLSWQIGAVVLGTVFLALASYIEVPMVPVPVTMQTFAVTLIGAVYGWRLGAATIVAWLVEGAIGLPVLAGGAAGAHHFVGPTAGYLFAFPVVGALTGWLAERGWNGNRPWLAFVAMLLGNALCLVLGAAWLSIAIGIEQAIVHGVTPFLIGGALKSALAAMTLKLMTRAQK
ncbi:biotin transporter BioY [Mesorhizobium sp.]|uniref:biotin transporter BioY n=1 Tax=Mesorhizobium sp. TaxID=1871066 RepID=UPI000FE615F2|nr:biotin transporter BioY [Mesorhizobium sp.]RWB01070.1 MAG: biotin transporter BioY [Mesorhizobium sp.]TIL28776.1 MAG: biotin transporter BioY [Mesorhizobium sp.]TIL42912.1 MAG: biotin transporter BioY [Mesorhizobium sp.]TIL48961.1 MAG: biotin transporter BioY [Mesorhizobium sp.]TIL60974.1 MAG: biotin transporter BioY [Mesorhizobium sp.]